MSPWFWGSEVNPFVGKVLSRYRLSGSKNALFSTFPDPGPKMAIQSTKMSFETGSFVDHRPVATRSEDLELSYPMADWCTY